MPVDTKFADMPWIVGAFLSNPLHFRHMMNLMYMKLMTYLKPIKEKARFVFCHLMKVIKKTTEDDQVLPKEIERTKISAEEARKRFEHCKVNALNADFSDKVTGTINVGFAVENSVYEANADGGRESTLTARFQRLQAEVRQLIDDVETVKKEAGASGGELSVEQISVLASSLTNQLGQLQLEEIFGPNLDLTDLCAHDALIQKRLLEQIANFKPAPRRQAEKTSELLSFELYSKPSDQADSNKEKTLELDRRLQRLEALLGSREVTETGPGGLLDTASRLSERISLLQPAYLDQVEARIASLQAKLASISKNPENSIVTDADTQNKVAELFEIVKKWDTFSADLPTVVDRLKDLQALHEQGSNVFHSATSEFSTALVNVELSQKRIDDELTSYSSQLKVVSCSFVQQS
ncbi:unnamed protein product [Mesocestoides corti]|uniref:Dynactin subunit 2 n=1 Tax=Mesocestoides corti TaxID=53468 RepID=A0A0R3U6M3_MESCO|nr:unnamed protein product [Mesocestoides corti]